MGQLLVAAVCTSAAAFAYTPGSGDSQRVICKNQTPTGTRFPVRTCRTAAQWETMAEENRRNYSDAQNRPLIRPDEKE